MTAKNTTTTAAIALILAAFALVGGAVIPTQLAAYAQLSGVSNIVDDTLERAGITEVEEETAAEDSNTEQQIQQPNDQQVRQQLLDQSEESNRNNDNAQTQTGAEDQDSAQGVVDGDDLAESQSESGDAKKYSTSSFTSGDGVNESPQDAASDGELNHDEHQTVDQHGTTIFGDDAADLDDTNVATPTAIPVNAQEELEEVLPPIDSEEDTITVCVGRENEEPETLEVTLAELAQLSADPDVEFIQVGSCDLLGG